MKSTNRRSNISTPNFQYLHCICSSSQPETITRRTSLKGQIFLYFQVRVQSAMNNHCQRNKVLKLVRMTEVSCHDAGPRARLTVQTDFGGPGPTCGENVCGHGQEGVGHHALRRHRDVQLPRHVAVNVGSEVFQLVTCSGQKTLMNQMSKCKIY